MTIPELKALAEAIGCSHLSGDTFAMYDIMRKELAGEEPVTSGWHGVHSGIKPEPDLRKEETYADCTSWNLNLDSMRVEIFMWDGHSLFGTRTRRRCSWTYQVKGTHVEILVGVGSFLEHQVKIAAEDAFLASEEERKKNFIDQMIGTFRLKAAAFVSANGA